MPELSKALSTILDNNRGERAAAKFLQENPNLLCAYFLNVRGHCQYVLSEVSLGGEYRMDSVVISGHSGSWDAYYIEFEPVGDKIFNKDRTYSARTKEALKQIADWRGHIRLNLTPFRRKLATLCQTHNLLILGEQIPKWEPCTYSNHQLKDSETIVAEHYWIISGRRDEITKDKRGLMARQLNEVGVHMASYDGFLDVAKAIDPPKG